MKDAIYISRFSVEFCYVVYQLFSIYNDGIMFQLQVCVRIKVGKKVFIHEEESGTDSSSWVCLFTMYSIFSFIYYT